MSTTSCLFADDKQTLWRWRGAVIDRLATLRLTIHPGAHPRPVTEGVPFLGFVVFPDRRRLKRQKAVHFRRRLYVLLREHDEGSIAADRIAATVRGWVNHSRYGDTVGLRKAVLRDAVVKPARVAGARRTS